MRTSRTDERVEAVAGPEARRFAYDEHQRTIGEYRTSAADVKAEHIWLMPDNDNGDGYEPLALAGPTAITTVHGDHLGAPALLTDASGAVVNRYDALPFGQRWAALATSPTTALAFPGQLIDAVDRHYNLHRDYDPTLGRYLQADPIGLAGGNNPYAYVEGDPVGFVDPDGLSRSRGNSGTTPRGDPLAAASIAQSNVDAAAAGVRGATFFTNRGSGFNARDAKWARQIVDQQIAARNTATQCQSNISSGWGRNRLEKELRNQGYLFDRPTNSSGGQIFRNPATGEEMRIMPRPNQSFRSDPPAKHQADFYYRYRTGPDQRWGPHTSIPDKK